MKIKFLILLLLPFLLTACATPVIHDSPSGKPEVTISGTTKDAIKDRLTDEMLSRNYTILQSADSMIVFERPIEDAMAAYMFSTKLSSTPTTRIAYNLASTKQGIRVIADCSAVSNPGTGFERKTNMNSHPDSMRVQSILYSMKNTMKRKK